MDICDRSHGKPSSHSALRQLALLLLVLGIFFRLCDLGDRPYWVDEVATSIRVAGYTKQQVIEQLADGQLHSIADLQHYQRLNVNQGWGKTLQALVQSPEHAPLYFLLARLWSQCFGSSVVAMRSFSVLLSLIALPVMAALSRALFAPEKPRSLSSWTMNGTINALSVALLSVSPFFVAYAQEARPYSLWIVVLLVMHWTLLKAVRTDDRLYWIGHSISTALALYTSLLSGLVILGHSGYVAMMQRWRFGCVFQHYILTLTLAIGAFVPWLVIVVQQWDTLQDNTTWTRGALGRAALLAIWLYNLAVLYFDVPVVLSPLWIGFIEVLTALAIVSFIGGAIYWLCRKTARWQWLLVMSLIVTTPACLIATDLLTGSQISTAARYWLPAHVGIQLAMIYLFTDRLSLKTTKSRWHGLLIVIIAISCISCGFQLYQSPKYQKSRNLHNQPIATILNQADRPLLIAESSQTLDVISLSYDLQPAVQFQILANSGALPSFKQCNVFVFNPSRSLLEEIQANSEVTLTVQYQPTRLVPTEMALSLWSIQSHRCHSVTKIAIPSQL